MAPAFARNTAEYQGGIFGALETKLFIWPVIETVVALSASKRHLAR